jgi:hypothetical protein
MTPEMVNRAPESTKEKRNARPHDAEDARDGGEGGIKTVTRESIRVETGGMGDEQTVRG